MKFRMRSARFFLQKLRFLVRTQVCRPGVTGSAREHMKRTLDLKRQILKLKRLYSKSLLGYVRRRLWNNYLTVKPKRAGH